MANELISEYLDLAALQKQTEAFRGQIALIKKDYDDLSRRETKLSISLNTRETVTGANEATKAIDKITDSTTRLDATTQKLALTRKQQIAIDKAERDEILAIQKEVERLTKLREKEAEAKSSFIEPDQSKIFSEDERNRRRDAAKAELEASNSPFTRDSSSEIGSYQNLTNQVKSNTQAKQENKLTTQQLVEADKLAALDNQKDKILLQQSNAELKNKAREELAVKGSLEQRRAALIRLKAAYDQLSPLERSSGFGQRLQTTIQGVNTQVLELEKSTGRAQRNVGNYGNAFTKAFSGAFGFIRQIAYVLPGIGLAGILGGIVDVVGNLVSALFKGKEALNVFAENYKNLNEVVGNANKAAGKEVADLKILYSVATDVNASMKDRLAAVNELQKEFPAYFAKIKDETILNGGAKDSYDKLTEAIIKSSRAAAAKTKIDALEAQRLDIEFQKQKIENATAAEKARAKDTQTKYLRGLQNDLADPNQTLNLTKSQNQQIIEFRRIAALKDQDDKDDAIKRQVDFLIKFAGGESKIAEAIEKNDKRKEKSVETIADAIAKLRNELKAIQLEQDQGIITFKDADLKRLEKYKDTIQEIFKLKDTDANKKAAVISLSEEIDPISLRVVKEQLKKFQKEAKKDLEEFAKISTIPPIEIKVKLDKQSEEKAYEDALVAQQRFLTIESSRAQLSLLQRYSAGKISREKYEEELLKIQEKYSQKAIQNQIDAYKQELKFAFVGVEQTQDVADKKTEILKKITELELQLQKSIVDGEGKSIKTRKEKLAEFLQAAQTIISDIGQSISEINGIKYDREKTRNEEQLTAIEKRKESEIAALDALTLSDQDRANKLAAINARTQAQKEQIDRKNRQLEVEKARFEKASNIANIITSTALAVVNTLKMGGPYAIALAVAVGLLGAAQLARAVSAPLPKYKHGKFDSYEGFAVVGDGGKAELRERKDGSFEITPSTPTLTYVQKEDRIYPDAAAFMRNRALKRTAGFSGIADAHGFNNFDNEGLKKEMRNVAASFAKRPVHETHIDGKGIYKVAKDSHNYTEYLNKTVFR